MFEQTYYQSILDSNPEYITQNQMRQICHISKRTCRYLLESGLVPNIDNGKKTHRYKIRTVDVVEYLQQREFSPSLFQAPEGYYAKKKRFEDMFSENDFVIMRGFYTDQLKSYSDVMNTAEISTFTGYSKNAVEHWCAKGYLKHFTTVVQGQVATVSFTNALRPGKISIQKVNEDGASLTGAKFLLQWSEDGKTWNNVAYSANADVVKGGCSNKTLVDGTLVTGEDGLLTWENLYPNIQYRITELEAPEGYTLLPDIAWEGTLNADDLTVSLRVVNTHTLILPETGRNALALMPLWLLLCTAVCMGTVFYLRRKEV